jgi:hypothetical protein
MRRNAKSIVVAALVAILTVGTAWGFWGAVGSGVATGTTGSLGGATISASSTSTGVVTVTWSAQAGVSPASAGRNAAIAYRVERKTGSGQFAAVTSGGCAGAKAHGVASCVDTVSESGAYTYRAVAQYKSWTIASNEVAESVTVDVAPGVPGTLSATAKTPSAGQSRGDVDLSWSAPSSAANLAGYTLYRSTTSGSGYAEIVPCRRRHHLVHRRASGRRDVPLRRAGAQRRRDRERVEQSGLGHGHRPSGRSRRDRGGGAEPDRGAVRRRHRRQLGSRHDRQRLERLPRRDVRWSVHEGQYRPGRAAFERDEGDLLRRAAGRHAPLRRACAERRGRGEPRLDLGQRHDDLPAERADRRHADRHIAAADEARLDGPRPPRRTSSGTTSTARPTA